MPNMLTTMMKIVLDRMQVDLTDKAIMKEKELECAHVMGNLKIDLKVPLTTLAISCPDCQMNFTGEIHIPKEMAVEALHTLK